MTDEEAAAIAARAEAATPGPWEMSSNERAYQIHIALPPSHFIELTLATLPWHTVWGDMPDTPANADFIAHARDDIPALLAERAALRELLGSVVAYVPRTVPDPEIVNIQAHARALLAGEADEGEVTP